MNKKLRISTLLMGSMLFIPTAHAGDWPQFRGPGGQGHVSVGRLPVYWDSTHNVVWHKTILGKAWSSPVVAGGRIYLTTAVPESAAEVTVRGESQTMNTPISLRVLSLDFETGQLVWDVEVSKVPTGASIHPKNSHASATPIVASGRIFFHFGPHGTGVLDEDGQVIWNKKISYNAVHGSGGSPVLWQNLMILNCDGGDRAFVVALDQSSGEERWRTARPPAESQRFSFSTPLVVDVDRQPQIVSAGSHAACGYDPRTGEELWVVKYPHKWSIVPRPVFGGGLVLVCTGYEGPAELLAIRPTGQGDVTHTHVAWRADKFVPHSPSPILHDGAVYLVSDAGIASCRDLQTGNLLWKKRIGGNFSASPLLAAQRVYLLSEDGVCTIVKAATEFEQVARNELEQPTFASMAAVDGDLLIRTEDSLYRIGD